MVIRSIFKEMYLILRVRNHEYSQVKQFKYLGLILINEPTIAHGNGRKPRRKKTSQMPLFEIERRSKERYKIFYQMFSL